MNPANDNERLPKPIGELFIGLAVLFDVLGVVFALFFIFAPLIIGTVAGIATAEYCKAHLDWAWLCTQLGYAVGTASGVATFVVEWFTGVGAAAIATAGHVLSMMVALIAWLTFTFLFLLRGIWFTGSKHAVRRLVFALGAALGEMLPLINMIPLTTISVYHMVKATRAEDAARKRAQEMQSFNPETSLRGVRQVPREERAEKLVRYKEQLAVQQEGLAVTQARMAEKLQENPDMSAREIYDEFVREGSAYGITEQQKAMVSDVARTYEERRRSIREIRSQYGDDRELYKALFGKYPNGRVQIIAGPASLYVRAFDPTDYGRIYYRTHDRSLSEEDLGHAMKTGGVTLGGAITAENASYHNDETESENIRRHEEQHAIKRLFGERLRPQRFNVLDDRSPFGRYWKEKESFWRGKRSDPSHNPTLAQPYLRQFAQELARAEDRARDEILAYVSGGTGPQDILAILTRPREQGGLYDYLSEHRERVRRDGMRESDIETVYGMGSSSEYYQTVARGIGATQRLMEQGYSLEEMKALLIHEPLTRWDKVVDRLENVPSPKISEHREEERRMSRREALRQVAGVAVRGAALGAVGGTVLGTLTRDTRKPRPEGEWINPDLNPEG